MGDAVIQIENRIAQEIPADLESALLKRSKTLHYSVFEHVFHLVWLYSDKRVGMAGDGGNGCCEVCYAEQMAEIAKLSGFAKAAPGQARRRV